MRREQVHKLCLNHYLDKDLEVRRKDDKTFYWAALDHSEADTPKTETFALRFKTPEIAAEFFTALNGAKVCLGLDLGFCVCLVFVSPFWLPCFVIYAIIDLSTLFAINLFACYLF